MTTTLLERRPQAVERTIEDVKSIVASAGVTRDSIERLADLLISEVVRYAGQTRAEDERFDFANRVLQCVNELEKKTAVGVHRAAYVAYQD